MSRSVEIGLCALSVVVAVAVAVCCSATRLSERVGGKRVCTTRRDTTRLENLDSMLSDNEKPNLGVNQFAGLLNAYTFAHSTTGNQLHSNELMFSY